MITNTKSIILDVGEQTLSEAISAKQYDVNSRFINLTVKNNGETIPLTEESTVIFNVKRPDGESKRFIGEVLANGTVNVPLDLWALTKAGAMQCDLSIIEDADAKLSTFAFPVQIEKASYNPKSMLNVGNYDVLMRIVTDYKEIKESLEQGAAITAEIEDGEDIIVEKLEGKKIKLKLSPEIKQLINKPMKRKTITLLANGWQFNNETNYYEYTIQDNDITYDHYMDTSLDLVNQSKLTNTSIESFNSYYKIYTLEQPSEDVTMTIVFMSTEEVV